MTWLFFILGMVGLSLIGGLVRYLVRKSRYTISSLDQETKQRTKANTSYEFLRKTMKEDPLHEKYFASLPRYVKTKIEDYQIDFNLGLFMSDYWTLIHRLNKETDPELNTFYVEYFTSINEQLDSLLAQMMIENIAPLETVFIKMQQSDKWKETFIVNFLKPYVSLARKMLVNDLIPGSYNLLKDIRFYNRWNNSTIIHNLNILFVDLFNNFINEIDELYASFIHHLEIEFDTFFDSEAWTKLNQPITNQSELEQIYQLFELDETASVADIKQAYRRLAKKYHPDLNNSINSEEIMRKINDGYEKLLAAKEE